MEAYFYLPAFLAFFSSRFSFRLFAGCFFTSFLTSWLLLIVFSFCLFFRNALLRIACHNIWLENIKFQLLIQPCTCNTFTKTHFYSPFSGEMQTDDSNLIMETGFFILLLHFSPIFGFRCEPAFGWYSYRPSIAPEKPVLKIQPVFT